MQLNVYDMDGTIVDSTAALRQCQIEGMYRATGQDASQLELLLKEKGLKGALSDLGLDQDTFFKTHYKTFDPFAAAKDGRMKVFDDVEAHFKKASIISPDGINCLISNSSIDATYRKLDAVNMRNKFDYVFAEVEKDKAKPTSYMAIQLRDKLIEQDKDRLHNINWIYNYGDQSVDMDFGEKLSDVLGRATNTIISAGRYGLPCNNYLIDRNNEYNFSHSFHGLVTINSHIQPNEKDKSFHASVSCSTTRLNSLPITYYDFNV